MGIENLTLKQEKEDAEKEAEKKAEHGHFETPAVFLKSFCPITHPPASGSSRIFTSSGQNSKPHPFIQFLSSLLKRLFD